MPSKNSIKAYAEGGYYHLYNRGVAKNEIFLEEQDYAVFLSYLKEYLSPFIPPSDEQLKHQGYFYFRKNYHQKIELIAFVLMPNHFHLLLKQNESRTIEAFMRSIISRYSRYFNKHHHRIGHLLQDVYKGILVENEEYFWWLSRYIHRNPIELLKKGKSLSSYPYSSYPAYTGLKKIEWINTNNILKQIKNYRDFVEGTAKDEPDDLTTYTLEPAEGDSF